MTNDLQYPKRGQFASLESTASVDREMKEQIKENRSVYSKEDFRRRLEPTLIFALLNMSYAHCSWWTVNLVKKHIFVTVLEGLAFQKARWDWNHYSLRIIPVGRSNHLSLSRLINFEKKTCKSDREANFSSNCCLWEGSPMQKMVVPLPDIRTC